MTFLDDGGQICRFCGIDIDDYDEKHYFGFCKDCFFAMDGFTNTLTVRNAIKFGDATDNDFFGFVQWELRNSYDRCSDLWVRFLTSVFEGDASAPRLEMVRRFAEDNLDEWNEFFKVGEAV